MYVVGSVTYGRIVALSEEFEIDRIFECTGVGALRRIGGFRRCGGDRAAPGAQPRRTRQPAAAALVGQAVVVRMNADAVGEERIALRTFGDEALRKHGDPVAVGTCGRCAKADNNQ